VGLPVDVIVTDGSAAAQAAKKATQRIPIVMGTSGADPISLGLDEVDAPNGLGVPEWRC
jgi:ABC-type uncharacterized transport system substrate-binding protein